MPRCTCGLCKHDDVERLVAALGAFGALIRQDTERTEDMGMTRQEKNEWTESARQAQEIWDGHAERRRNRRNPLASVKREACDCGCEDPAPVRAAAKAEPDYAALRRQFIDCADADPVQSRKMLDAMTGKVTLTHPDMDAVRAEPDPPSPHADGAKLSLEDYLRREGLLPRRREHSVVALVVSSYVSLVMAVLATAGVVLGLAEGSARKAGICGVVLALDLASAWGNKRMAKSVNQS